MKSPYTITSNNVRLIAAVVLLGLNVRSVADGTGRIRTPYSIHDNVTVGVVTEKRKQAGHTVQADLAVKGHHQTLENVRFAYSVPKGRNLASLYSINCTKTTGGDYTLDLADIQSLTVIMQDLSRHRLMIVAEIFPDITPARLVQLQPTASILKRNYHKSLKLWLSTADRLGRSLLMCDDMHQIPLDNLFKDTVVSFKQDSDSLWWSIPSVTDDPNYSHRGGSKM